MLHSRPVLAFLAESEIETPEPTLTVLYSYPYVINKLWLDIGEYSSASLKNILIFQEFCEVFSFYVYLFF